MSGEISVDWLVGLGGQQIIGEHARHPDHVEFRDGYRLMEAYPDAEFLVVSIAGEDLLVAKMSRLKFRSDFSHACRLFQFKIDGLEVAG